MASPAAAGPEPVSFEITCLDSGEPVTLTVDAAEAASLVAWAGEHGVKIRIRPLKPRPCPAPAPVPGIVTSTITGATS